MRAIFVCKRGSDCCRFELAVPVDNSKLLSSSSSFSVRRRSTSPGAASTFALSPLSSPSSSHHGDDLLASPDPGRVGSNPCCSLSSQFEYTPPNTFNAEFAIPQPSRGSHFVINQCLFYSQWRRQGGSFPPLWVDVQKLCNMCVLSLSWNFFVSHDKYIARPSSKEPR